VGNYLKILLEGSFLLDTLMANCSKIRMASHKRVDVDSKEMCIT